MHASEPECFECFRCSSPNNFQMIHCKFLFIFLQKCNGCRIFLSHIPFPVLHVKRHPQSKQNLCPIQYHRQQNSKKAADEKETHCALPAWSSVLCHAEILPSAMPAVNSGSGFGFSNRRTASGANSILASSNGVPVTICSSGYDRSVPTCSTICSQPYELNVWQISLTLPLSAGDRQSFPVSADRLQKVAVLSVQAHKCCIPPRTPDFGTEINQRRNSWLYTDRKSASSARTA